MDDGSRLPTPDQEVGGVLITLAALCLSNEIDMAQSGEIELARVWTSIDKIRTKQDAKRLVVGPDTIDPLPGKTPLDELPTMWSSP